MFDFVHMPRGTDLILLNIYLYLCILCLNHQLNVEDTLFTTFMYTYVAIRTQLNDEKYCRYRFFFFSRTNISCVCLFPFIVFLRSCFHRNCFGNQWKNFALIIIWIRNIFDFLFFVFFFHFYSVKFNLFVSLLPCVYRRRSC